MTERLLILGLDCLEPSLAFHRWASDLPNITAIRERGLWGRLRTTDPPITVPAWMSMCTSRDPGQLGIYGFRNRRSYEYGDLFIVNSSYVRFPTIWETIGAAGGRSIVLGVPLTFPPKPFPGKLACSFLAPGKDVQWTHPEEFARELDELAGGDYIVDVTNFRTDDKDSLLGQIYRMTDARFRAARALVARETWTLFMMVEMGPDRIHHAFWRFHDKDHRLYEPGNRYENVIHDYYVHLDQRVGELANELPEDTALMLVSDHGAGTMQGAVCVNEWLEREGYLAFKEKPDSMTRFSIDMLDMTRTKAWGEGGYYARVFMNVQGREPQGVIPADRYDEVRDELVARFEAITDPEGRNIGTVALKPQDLYADVKGIPPDLAVYFGDLRWRSAGSVGTGAIHMFENDTGPDDANHTRHGIFALAGDGVSAQERREISIYDVAPTALALLGIDPPQGIRGKALV